MRKDEESCALAEPQKQASRREKGDDYFHIDCRFLFDTKVITYAIENRCLDAESIILTVGLSNF